MPYKDKEVYREYMRDYMRRVRLKYYYLFTSGAYSDYYVDFLMGSTTKIDEGQFHLWWLEAVRRSSEHHDNGMLKIAEYLNVPIQKNPWDYGRSVSQDKYIEAKEAVGFESLGDSHFFQEVLLENRLVLLETKEYNMEYDL